MFINSNEEKECNKCVKSFQSEVILNEENWPKNKKWFYPEKLPRGTNTLNVSDTMLYSIFKDSETYVKFERFWVLKRCGHYMISGGFVLCGLNDEGCHRLCFQCKRSDNKLS